MVPIAYRPATDADVEPTYHLFVRATNDLLVRRNLLTIPSQRTIPARALAFRRHVLAHDRERYWVAEDGGDIVGFGIATLREALWYLAALHVHPNHQGRGIGRRLLELCLPPADSPITRIVISDSLNPDSNALYAKHGLYQSVPLLVMRGRTASLAQVGGPLRAELVEDPRATADLDPLDLAVLGTTRRPDHEFWVCQPGQALWLFRDRDATLAAYAYVSEFGIGPAAARDQHTIVSVLGHCLEQRRIAGADEVIVKIPAACHAGVDHLLRRGFRYDQILLIGASRLPSRLDRYLVSVGDALF